ncbi:O-methyltransferase [Sphingomonas sp. HITSZ_GF]|uniref:O-methyltransferase n=1 Tax=Sphingomonas sp. HITSZ_GF TaxID=3037247 RepID=UPI00240DF589|nr:O-methyltransferase [Sphingomonas sp. HITSZ_GF]MDG2532767.1 O-methyltransferase [Sphingomonas sp. HITSZ_GF]
MMQDWAAVDSYIAGHLLAPDAALDGALVANAAGGLPAIDVSAPQGKLLQLVAQIAGARRILEVGTLGGYSTIWLARALPAEGRLVTLELEPRHAEVARANLERAGVAERCEVRTGPAVDSLAAMVAAGEAPFDLVFVDADKPSNVAYLDAALKLTRPGSVLVFDNVVRSGAVTDAGSADPSVRGTRALYDVIAAEPRLDATAIQTVGDKGWDGFLLAVVKR